MIHIQVQFNIVLDMCYKELKMSWMGLFTRIYVQLKMIILIKIEMTIQKVGAEKVIRKVLTENNKIQQTYRGGR